MHTATPAPRKIAITIIMLVLALVVFIGWSVMTPPGLLGKADAVAYAICHRIEARSFHIGERQLPLCARCSGTFLGAVIGLGYQAAAGKKRTGHPKWQVILPLGIMALAFAIDGGNSYLHLIKTTYPGSLENIPNLYLPNNTLRLLTGTGMGLGIAALLFPAFNQIVWADGDDRPALSGIQSFAIPLGMALVVDLLVLTGQPAILYPVALISTAGTLLVLTMVYCMLWIVVMRQENIFTQFRQLWLPGLAGLTLAIIQIGAIDAARYWLTGTWGSFPLS